MDPLAEPEFTHHRAKRLCPISSMSSTTMSGRQGTSSTWPRSPNDLGSQVRTVISLDVYREFYAPHHKRSSTFAMSSTSASMHHTTGSMRAFCRTCGDGIDILNPVQ